MSATRNSANDSTSNSTHSAYFAVDPALVVRVARLFEIQSSILEKGAKSLYDKASNIEAGRETTRWGRHKQSVIEQFCEYTTTQGQMLPWHELVEHVENYDGTEGITPRTGNKPLSTTTRLAVQSETLKNKRLENQLSLEILAQNTSLPEPFLAALESGDWPTVAQSTAETIASSLSTPREKLFQNLDTNSTSRTDETSEISSRSNNNFSFKKLSLSFAGLGLFFLIFYLVYNNYNGEELSPQADLESSNRFFNSHWFGTIAQVDKAIYIKPGDLEFWTKGTYIYLRKNGSIGYNQDAASNYLLLPHPETQWTFENRQLTISFGELFYKFDLEKQSTPDRLITISNEGSWEMTLKAVDQSQ